MVKQKKMIFNVNDVFGCSEKVPQLCPTFLERDVHKEFQNALLTKNIVVVYGESKQGKTWAIERYCPNQCRIGCTNDMDLDKIKLSILDKLDIHVQKIEYQHEQEVAQKGSAELSGTAFKIIKGEAKISKATKRTEKVSSDFYDIDINDLTGYVQKIRDNVNDKCLVFDNFHYLSPEIQKQFCSMLKEFIYEGIKVIIVGVWKEASKITSLAPDLGSRCKHIDIGTWKCDDLHEVALKGESALNIKFSNDIFKLYYQACANNIGIFKDLLLQLCLKHDVVKTQDTLQKIDDLGKAQTVIDSFVEDEAYAPLRDRIKNLAMPQRERKESRHMRQKLVTAILRLLIKNNIDEIRVGIPTDDIIKEVSEICKTKNEDEIPTGNLMQELGVLHEREENTGAGENYIPLFYLDKANKKLLVLEPNLYVIKNYSVDRIQQIASDISI